MLPPDPTNHLDTHMAPRSHLWSRWLSAFCMRDSSSLMLSLSSSTDSTSSWRNNKQSMRHSWQVGCTTGSIYIYTVLYRIVQRYCSTGTLFATRTLKAIMTQPIYTPGAQLPSVWFIFQCVVLYSVIACARLSVSCLLCCSQLFFVDEAAQALIG